MKRILIGLMLFPSLAYAGDITTPNTFTDGVGNTILAAEVNANFSEIDTEVDDNDARIDALLTTDTCNMSPCDLASGTTLGGATIQTGVDDDVPEAGDFGAATDLNANGNIIANAVNLATNTEGNYIATLADAGAGEVTVTGSGVEDAAVTVALVAGITRDIEWDTAAEINAATTDEDFLLDSDIGTTVQGFDAANTVDTDWDTAAELNAATTDTDMVLDTDIGVTVQAFDADLADLADGTLSASAIDPAITRDSEWDTAAEINSATTDEDFVTESQVREFTFHSADPASGNCSPGDMWATGATDCLYVCVATNTWGACKN